MQSTGVELRVAPTRERQSQEEDELMTLRTGRVRFSFKFSFPDYLKTPKHPLKLGHGIFVVFVNQPWPPFKNTLGHDGQTDI